MPICGVAPACGQVLRRCGVPQSTPHSSGFRALPQAGFRKTQLASSCLREAASAKAGAFLSSLWKMAFSVNY